MGFFDKAQEAVGLKPSEEQQEEMDESVFGSICPKLSFQQVSWSKPILGSVIDPGAPRAVQRCVLSSSSGIVSRSLVYISFFKFQ